MPYQAENSTRSLKAKIVHSVEFDLSAAAATDFLFVDMNRAYTVRSIHVYYTEATSSDAGVAIKVGTPADDDRFTTKTSGVSKLINTSEVCTLTATTSLAIGTPLVCSSAGSKVGTGIARVVVELSPVEPSTSSGMTLQT